MPAKDGLARRRYEKLVDRLEGLMRASLKPRYRGYHGQLILSSCTRGGPSSRLAPETHVVGARLFVYDDREIPKEISELAAGDASDAIDAELRGRE